MKLIIVIINAYSSECENYISDVTGKSDVNVKLSTLLIT
jgi:hypothetical protein